MWIELDRLQKAGFKLKQSKYKWFHDGIGFCSFLIDQEGVHTLDLKTGLLIKWPWPRNTKVVHGFLCPIRYHQNFTWHYAHTTLPLYSIYKISQ